MCSMQWAEGVVCPFFLVVGAGSLSNLVDWLMLDLMLLVMRSALQVR